jgi:hypothetical protein
VIGREYASLADLRRGLGAYFQEYNSHGRITSIGSPRGVLGIERAVKCHPGMMVAARRRSPAWRIPSKLTKSTSPASSSASPPPVGPAAEWTSGRP